MNYLGEHLSPKLLQQVNKTLMILGGVFGLAVAALAVTTYLNSCALTDSKEQIVRTKEAIRTAEEQRDQGTKTRSTVPRGLAAIGDFQNRLTKIARTRGCSIAQFQASDQTNPYISTFTVGAQANGNWVQVEAKMNLQGTTSAVVGTLQDMPDIGIPFEFSSVEMSRTQASPTGEATVTANVSIRVLTVAGGA
jgi:hypothetical protein